MDDDAPRKKATAITPGEDVSTLSAHELEARIRLLEAEIARLKAAIAQRAETRASAESFFRR